MSSPLELINELQDKDFDYFLNELLSEVPEDIDTRQGSIIYDALAPAATKLAETNLDIINVVTQSHIATASGEFLDYFAQGKGTSRNQATYAKVTAKVTDENHNIVTSIDIGDRFASIGSEPIFYSVIKINDDGSVLLQSELSGITPNAYIGQILPVTPNDSINWAKITEISISARDEESDDSLRERLLSVTSSIKYGGNFNDYQNMVDDIKDVGAVQIYPAWKGGGTVKLTVLDNSLNLASTTLINEVKNIIDPTENSGLGYGLAPIGHEVTVNTPEVLKVSIKLKLMDDGKISSDTLNNNVKDTLQNYFSLLKNTWGKAINNRYSLTIFRSQVLSKVLQIEHVINADMPVLNDENKDIDLIFNNSVSQLPVLDEVIINGQ